MTRDEIKSALVDFVCENFLVDEHEIDLEDSLVDQGVIDSFGLVEIAAFLKKTYAIRTEEGEINRDNFGSIARISRYVERKAPAAEPTEGDLTPAFRTEGNE